MKLLSTVAADKHSAKKRPKSPQTLHDEFHALWRSGQFVDADSFRKTHPEIDDDRELLLDLIYDEFLYRLERGEAIELESFAKRYPDFEESLRNLAAAEEAFELRPELIRETDPWPSPGDVIMNCRLLRLIGKGSFSRVYLAENESTGRNVVLKVTTEGVQEAKLLGRLKHPNIIDVLFADEDPKTGYGVVCMPYVGETTLLHVLDAAYDEAKAPESARELLPQDSADDDQLDPVFRRGDFVDGALHQMLQLSAAIAKAHAEGIQHRDIKPTNVLLGANGDVRVLDFNLSVKESETRKLTGGTLPYMSPEQLHAVCNKDKSAAVKNTATPIAKASDVYSLGVLFYEILTGSHPYAPFPPQRTGAQFRDQLLTGFKRKPTPVREVNPNVPAKLSAVIDKCLATDPKKRYDDAGALHAALQKVARPTVRVRRWAFRRLRSLATGMAAAIWLFVLAFFAWSKSPDAVAKNWNLAVAQAERGRFDKAEANLNAAVDEGLRSPEAIYLRGRLHMLQGRWTRAIVDLQEAKNRLSGGRVDACLAYCYAVSATKDYALGEHYSRKALEMGFANAAVYNNLAYCCMKQKSIHRHGEPGAATAGDYLRHAASLDSNNTTVFYNLAHFELKVAYQHRFDFQPAVDAIDQTLQLSRPTARLYWDAARIYSFAYLCCRVSKDGDAAEVWKKRTATAMNAAIALGLPSRYLENDEFLRINDIRPTANPSNSSPPCIARNDAHSVPFAGPPRILDPLDGQID